MPNDRQDRMLEALPGRSELADKSAFCRSLTLSQFSISKLSRRLTSTEDLLHFEEPPTLTLSEKGNNHPKGVLGRLYTTWLQRLPPDATDQIHRGVKAWTPDHNLESSTWSWYEFGYELAMGTWASIKQHIPGRANARARDAV